MEDALMKAVMEVQAAWVAAFERHDADALAALYTAQTAFYGSTAALHTDRAGVRSYFAALPPSFQRASYGRPHLVPLGPDAVSASGLVEFEVETAGQPRQRHPYRMTHILVRTGGAWKIATHHASPVPAGAAAP